MEYGRAEYIDYNACNAIHLCKYCSLRDDIARCGVLLLYFFLTAMTIRSPSSRFILAKLAPLFITLP
jgi:hypothetical protein